MLFYQGSASHRVTSVLEAHHAPGYTEFANAHGSGVTGRVEGSRAWPGQSTVVVTIVPDDRVPALEDALRGLAAEAQAGERLHVAVLPVEHFF
jgi:hypothetical protein